jgi:hypothetical protein
LIAPRPVPELDAERLLRLPPEELRRELEDADFALGTESQVLAFAFGAFTNFGFAGFDTEPPNVFVDRVMKPAGDLCVVVCRIEPFLLTLRLRVIPVFLFFTVIVVRVRPVLLL